MGTRRSEDGGKGQRTDGYEDPSFFSMLTAGVAQIWQRLLTKAGSLDASR